MKVRKTFSLDERVVEMMNEHIDNKSGYVNSLIIKDIKRCKIKI